MTTGDVSADAGELARARGLLDVRPRRDPMWPAMAAATALALTSVMFAAVAVLAPPARTEHVAVNAPG